MQLLPLITLLAVLPFLLFLLQTFDHLLRLERERFPEAWKADGRPFTILSRRPDMPRSIRSWLAQQRCAFVWLFITPHWVPGDSEALGLHQRLRRLFAVWVFLALPLYLLSVLLSVALH